MSTLSQRYRPVSEVDCKGCVISVREFLQNIALGLLPLLSAVFVALLNNWEKINPGKKHIKEVLDIVKSQKEEVDKINHRLDNMESAQRTALQTQILEKCKRINNAIDNGDQNFEEDLKQLIILYKEYHNCGYNSQGKLYFNSTIDKASEDHNVLVRELMNMYFPDYEP